MIFIESYENLRIGRLKALAAGSSSRQGAKVTREGKKLL
jgi:hypothetical protein